MWRFRSSTTQLVWRDLSPFCISLLLGQKKINNDKIQNGDCYYICSEPMYCSGRQIGWMIRRRFTQHGGLWRLSALHKVPETDSPTHDLMSFYL